jgi:serine/threonine-protein kinase
VYRAEDLRVGQQVALKLSPLGVTGNRTTGRFAREVRLARGIAHPNVCRVFDLGEADGWSYLSMEYVDGETLESILTRIGRLPQEKAIDIARQLCAGLGAAHAQGVLHRDLKPSNIMLDGRGRVRIMDFGLAMRAADRAAQIAGTPAYMAPEQVTGAVASEQADLYALGLVLYELFTGRRAIEVSTIAERAHAVLDPDALEFQDKIDPAAQAVVRMCLAVDPRERPRGTSHVASQLPGGDAIAAALAEGRTLPPDIVASAQTKGTIAPVLAWTTFALIVGGVVSLAKAGGLLTFTATEMPKPPDVLAERAQQILSGIGQTVSSADTENWFEAPAITSGGRTLRFVYRTSPAPLVPQNLFHYVTRSDPPMDAAGMATVILHPSGRLLSFTRFASSDEGRPDRASWADLLSAAGIAIGSIEQTAGDPRPPVPHDAVIGWLARRPGDPPVSVHAATLADRPVYFDAIDPRVVESPRRLPSIGRNAGAEGLLWLFVAIIFGATIVMVRRNLREGEGDLHGARRLAIFMGSAGMLSIMLHAHHVANPTQELLLTLGVCGWVMVWSGFSWLSYVAFEPHVRHLWPRSLVSWTRLLGGKVRDPLIGRDVLLGIAAGVLIVGTSLLRIYLDGDGPSSALAVALDSVRSPRHLLSRVVFAVADGIQYALGGFFVLLLLRLIFRRTWLAAILFVALFVPVSGNSATIAGVVHAAGGAALAVGVFLQIGLLAGVAMLTAERLLTHIPLTLDFNAWYAGYSIVVTLLVLGLAAWACSATLRPATPPTASRV